MRTPDIVLLGGPNSGKTHFAGQLYGRLQRNPGHLKLRRDAGTPPDLTPLQEVLKCLEDGKAAGHTSADTWAEIMLPLVSKAGSAINLNWPDYGGEQLRSVFNERRVPEAWRERLMVADGWIVMIRLNSETTYSSALGQLLKGVKPKNSGTARTGWDANAYWVEVFQILLHVGQVATQGGIRSPKLVVLLSCYDELKVAAKTPSEILERHLPLLYSYISTNWNSESFSIWGLSSLGKPLEPGAADDEFVDQGPENQGWVVPPDAKGRDGDLTAPIAWILSE